VTVRTIRHWTPRYIWDRLGLWSWERRHPHDPWLTRDAVRLIAELIRPSDQAFEWGSGRSTIWLAARVRRLRSVEHDPGWHERVRSRLAARGDVEVLLAPGTEAAPSPDYVRAIERFDDGSIDLALVDGIRRDECAHAAVGKVAPNGLLVIDNANWFLPSSSRSPNSRRPGGADAYASPLWREVAEALAGWRRIWTSNGVTDTAIWFRGPMTTQTSMAGRGHGAGAIA
jgi:hypothetical protein